MEKLWRHFWIFNIFINWRRTKKIVQKDGTYIRYINNPSEDLQLEAVKQNGYALEYINNPSERVQIEAIKQYPFNIEYIHNPSEKLQLLTVTQNPLAIIYIKDPTEKVIQEAVKGINYSFDSNYVLRHIEKDLKEE